MSYKFIRLEIFFLLIYHTEAEDIAVVKSGTRNDFRTSCLYEWHWTNYYHDFFSNVAKIRYYFLYTIIVNRNWHKTTKVAFLSEVQNLFVGNFFASCVMVVSLFSMLFKCVSSWQEGVSLWLVIGHYDTQKMFSHFTLVLESELSSVLETCIRAAWLQDLSFKKKKISQNR